MTASDLLSSDTSSRIVTPRTLKGFTDRMPEEALAKSAMLSRLAQVFCSFGYAPIETPHLEYFETLNKEGGQEIQHQMYRFTDHGDRDVALRFDLTVPLARYVVQHRNALGLPFKRYCIGNVFRGENPQAGRYREFTQCDFDIVGSHSIGADAEIVQVMASALQHLGIADFEIRINHRQFLEGYCKSLGLSSKAPAILRILDKSDKESRESLATMLREGEGLTSAQIEDLFKLFTIKEGREDMAFLQDPAALRVNDETAKALDDLIQLFRIVQPLASCRAVCKLDLTIVRGLGYYTGIVYETTLTALPSIGSVCSGGRYDNLTQVFSREAIPAVGASVGLDRLLAACRQLGLLHERPTPAEILVTFGTDSSLPQAHALAHELRLTGKLVEVYPESAKLKKQLTYANRKAYKFVVIVQEEATQSKLSLKNMTTGDQQDVHDAAEITHLMGSS